MPNQTFIATLDRDNTDQPFALHSLADAIALNDALALITADDGRVQFSGPSEIIDKYTSHFAGRLLIEADVALTLDDPTPGRGTLTPRPLADGDDKDPNEIVEF